MTRATRTALAILTTAGHVLIRLPIWIVAWPFILGLHIDLRTNAESDRGMEIGALATFVWLGAWLLIAQRCGSR